MNLPLQQSLFREILMARKRVYSVAQPTPLETIELPGGLTVLLKREDLSPIHAYKWRGAFNRMAQLSAEEIARGVVCASAGNHAQGVALAARRLQIHATVYMPVSTPRMKQQAVRLHGGDQVDIILVGDTYDEAADAAREAARDGRVFVHAYDDLATMGGQGTIADEVVMSGEGPFDAAFLQIGGGGMAAGVACWLKAYYPGIQIVGVEGVDQASMAAAVAAGHPVTLPHVDVFCDGTAVKRAGDLTYPLCAALIDEFITVTNEEVCAAIELLWEKSRCIAEPAGAMGLAGLQKCAERWQGKRVIVILCGANLDFEKLAWISSHAAIGAARRRFYRFEMAEAPGGLLHLIENIPDGINIIEVQYGKVDADSAWPVIGFEASPPALRLLEQRFQELGIPHEAVTSQADVEFRIINYEPALFRLPYFITFDFPERAGALRDLLVNIQGVANICYFNYAFTGEVVGHALLGFEFESLTRRERFQQMLGATKYEFRALDPVVLQRML